MRTIEFKRFGPPDVLEVVERPQPKPAAGEVLVQVHAAGVNFFEVLMRADRYAVTPQLPMVPGVEVAGTITGLGEGTDPSLLGARVGIPLFGVGRGSGGHAEFIAIEAASVIRLPDALSFEDAVALMVQGLTALYLVRQAPPAGKTVLVNAAAGGVGSLLVQLARLKGAKRVIGAAGSEEKRLLALSLGADLAIDPNLQDAQIMGPDGAGVDIAYDTVGGKTTKSSLVTLAPGGQLVFAALGRFELDKADLNGMFERNQSLTGFALLPLLTKEGLWNDLSELFQLAIAGQLKVLRGQTFALHEAALAHRAIENRETTGKVVLTA